MSDDNKIDPRILGGNPGRVTSPPDTGFTLRPKLTGVTSINRKVVYVGVGVLTAIAAIAVLTFNNAGKNAMSSAGNAIANQGGDAKPVSSAKGTLWYENKPSTYEGLTNPAAPAFASAPTGPSKVLQTGVPDLTGRATTFGGAATGQAGGTDSRMREQELATAQQQARDKEQKDLSALQTAQDSKLDAPDFGTKNSGMDSRAAATAAALGGMGGGSNAAPQLMPAAFGAADREADPNKQDRKDSFLKDARTSVDSDYNQAVKTKQRTPYELKAGWLIPGVMISGLNSDLPGEVIAQVREPVYDSRGTGKLLIPAGARLVGIYDAHVAYGQERVLVVWNRVIFEDGSSYNLKGMPGADQAGYAGFFDDVNNHYLKTFAAAGVIAVLGAGVQLSQPNNGNSTNQQPSVSSTLGASLGQQLGQTGMTITQKNLNIQPTLTVAPGYRFNIMVTADCVLEPITQ